MAAIGTLMQLFLKDFIFPFFPSWNLYFFSNIQTTNCITGNLLRGLVISQPIKSYLWMEGVKQLSLTLYRTIPTFKHSKKETLYRTIPTFDHPKKETFWKHCEKGESAGNQHFLPFLQNNSVFNLHLFCRLQMLWIWTRLKLCRLVKS